MAKRSRAELAEDRRRLVVALEAGGQFTAQSLQRHLAGTPGPALSVDQITNRLAELMAEGRVRITNPGGRPRLYELVGATVPRTVDVAGLPASASLTPPAAIPLSREGERLLTWLRQPRTLRPPVGYDAGFLDAYIPGTTWYLDADLRAALTALGRTVAEGQPAGTYARDIMQRLVIDLSWGSSRLEGLKYSRIDTKELLDAGRTPPGATPKDRQLILNHKTAIEFLVESAEEIRFDRYTVMSLHAMLAENLLGDPAQEGQLRTRAVTIGTSVYTPTEIPQVIEECFDRILATADAIPDPIEQSFFVMVHIPYLQPFIDVNKRTSRLAANIPLIRANLCPLSFVEVPEDLYTEGMLGVYERRDVSLLRDVFRWAYERSCAQFSVLRAAMGEPDRIRLEYRTTLRGIVSEIVKSGTMPGRAFVAAMVAHAEVPEPDRDAVVDEVFRDLADLRLETIARYALRPSELHAWKAATAAGPRS